MKAERIIRPEIESLGLLDLESQIDIGATDEGINIVIGRKLAKRVVEKVRREKAAEGTSLLASPSLKPTLIMEIVPNGLIFGVERQAFIPLRRQKEKKEESLITFGAFDLPDLINNRSSLPQIGIWLRALRESLTEEIAGNPNEFPKASFMTILVLKMVKALNEKKIAETNKEVIEQTRVFLRKRGR